MSNILGIQGVTDANLYTTSLDRADKSNNTKAFDTLLQSALSMIEETNDWANKVKEEEIKYALGQSSNPHDLRIAQTKANMSLQYTLAVRNSVVEAYKEIMNLQF